MKGKKKVDRCIQRLKVRLAAAKRWPSKEQDIAESLACAGDLGLSVRGV